MQIVLARLDDDVALVRAGRVDLGEQHTFRPIKKPVALMWKNDGTDADRAKAQRFAAAEGYSVFCYEGEREPLIRARADVLAAGGEG